MNANAVAAFGALRFSDEHELMPWQIAQRARLRSRVTVAALREMRRLGIVWRRREGRYVYYGLASNRCER